MIDLTPLDVRKKRGDFKKGLRGYEPQEVEAFLELVAERLEELVKENLTLTERAARLAEQVDAQTGRERAVHEALVTAQELREEIRGQAQREAEQIRRDAERDALHREREAEARARDIVADAERQLKERQGALEEMERRRARFLTAFRQLLQRELDVVAVEEGRAPLENVAVELDLGGGREPHASFVVPAGVDPFAPLDPEPTDPDLVDADAVALDDDRAPDSLVALAPDEAPEDRPGADVDVHLLAASMGLVAEIPEADAASGEWDEGPVLDIGMLAATGGAHAEDDAPPAGAHGVGETTPSGGEGGSGSGTAERQESADGAADPPESRAGRSASDPLAGIPTLEDLLGESGGEDDDER